MESAASASLWRALMILLCALASVLGDTEAYSDKELKERYAKRKVAPDRLKRTSECAKRWEFCKGRYRNSKRSCCEHADDECTVIGPKFSACIPRPEESDKELKEAYAKRKVAPDRLKRTSECAKRWEFCKGRYRNSKRSCCEDPSDECKVVGPKFSACFPKRGLLRDGKECATDAECVNACVSEPCNKHSLEDSGDCGGVCRTLATVEYMPPADSGNSMISTTAKRKLSAKTPRRAACPRKAWKRGKVCHRFRWHRKCSDRDRCSWRTKKFKNSKGGWQRKWCGVCTKPPSKPIFNC